jgi:hypothetical protein
MMRSRGDDDIGEIEPTGPLYHSLIQNVNQVLGSVEERSSAEQYGRALNSFAK